MDRIKSYRQKREIVNKIENSKSIAQIYGWNAWKMSLRSTGVDK